VLALVRYRQGRDDEALHLERLALSNAEATNDPAALAWAGTALLSNIAKLLEARFGDSNAALETYLEGAAREGSIGSVRARLHAARLMLDREAWEEVVELLDGESGSPIRTIAERVQIELMLATAYAGLGEAVTVNSRLTRVQSLISRYPRNPFSAKVDTLISAIASQHDDYDALN
jgi:hypothetical protein